MAFKTIVNGELVLVAKTSQGPKIIRYDPERMKFNKFVNETSVDVPEGFQEALEKFLLAQDEFLSVAEPSISDLSQAIGPL